jgi:hypothetical protein
MYFSAGDPEINYTGLLNDPVSSVPVLILSFLFLLWLTYMTCQAIPEKKKEMLLSAGMITIALLIPYDEKIKWLSMVHIICAYAAFTGFNLVFIPFLFGHRKHFLFYQMVCFFCLLHSFVHGAVTGISEIVWASGVCIILALLN